jgi:3-hydroxy-9,10-secoandrosta-1,3,5(10)-triene-9,17-dione monooxygenase reductase component
MDPPLILWSQDKNARSLNVFKQAEHFVVNVLSADQVGISNTFARTGTDKFRDIAIRDGIGGAPVLGGCAARFQCKKTFTYEGGDHLIFVGEVLEFDESGRKALLFHKGQYSVSEPHPVTDKPAGGHKPSGFVADYLDYLLSQAAVAIQSKFETVLRRESLERDSFRVLCTLSDHDKGIGAGELSIIDLLPTEQIDRVLTVMITNGWVSATTAIDGSNLYVLTTGGREKIVPVLAAAKAHEAEVLGDFSATDVRQLKEMLKNLIRWMRVK